MAAKIFISYRRDDSAGHAGRVMDRLEREFGRDLLFMDVETISPGTNFAKVLSEEVSKCGVLLAVIGSNWSDVRDKNGNRRLDDPNDYVRIEIAAALQRNIPVIPILLDGARIPEANQLPDELKELASRNAVEIRHTSFHSDVDRLIRGVEPHLKRDVTPGSLDVAMADAHALREVFVEVPSGFAAEPLVRDIWEHVDKEDARAMFALALCFEVGYGVTSKDTWQAANLLRCAADKGDTRAQHNLGLFYVNGRGGLRRD